MRLFIDVHANIFRIPHNVFENNWLNTAKMVLFSCFKYSQTDETKRKKVKKFINTYDKNKNSLTHLHPTTQMHTINLQKKKINDLTANECIECKEKKLLSLKYNRMVWAPTSVSFWTKINESIQMWCEWWLFFSSFSLLYFGKRLLFFLMHVLPVKPVSMFLSSFYYYFVKMVCL